MAGEHAEVALRARYVDLLNVAGEQQFLGRDEIEMEGGHGVMLASLCRHSGARAWPANPELMNTDLAKLHDRWPWVPGSRAPLGPRDDDRSYVTCYAASAASLIFSRLTMTTGRA